MKVAGKTINVELFPATVLQVDQSASTNILTDTAFFPLKSNAPHTYITFQLKENDTTLPLDVPDAQLPMYKEQEVDIISLNQSVVGFVDIKSREYYYITNDFCSALHFSIHYFLICLFGITGAILVLGLLKTNYTQVLGAVPLAIVWLLCVIKKFNLNKEIETAVDEFMQDK